MSKTVPEILREGADTYEERNKIYGDNYKRHGEIMRMLFPQGVNLLSHDAHNRFGVLTQVVAKLTRYCENFDRGGHADSIHDLIVYASMLSELDGEINEYKVAEQGQKGVEQEPLTADWSKLFSDDDKGTATSDDFGGIPDTVYDAAGEGTRAAEVPADAPATEPPVVIPEPPVQK